MDIQTFLMTAVKEDLIFLAVAVLLVMVIGFPIADKVMTRGYSLKKALFEDDNTVAGLEFGGMLLALLYISHSSISGETVKDASLSSELIGSSLTLAISIVLLLIAREILNMLVRSFNGGADLNDEIFNQKNVAAAAVSMAITISVVNGLTEEDTMGPEPGFHAVMAATVMVGGLLSIILYRFTHLKGSSFMKKFFEEDMAAAGVSLLGFVFAANLLIANIAAYVQGLDTISHQGAVTTTLGLSVGFILLLAIIRLIFMFAINKMLSTNLNSELYEQNNIGAGFIDAGLCIGCSLLLVGAFV